MGIIKGLFPVVTNSDFAFSDAIFDNFFNEFENPTKAGYQVPRVDIEETETDYLLTVDLPGMSKKDIKITYKDDVLTLVAKKESQDDDANKKHFLRKERLSPAYCRQFSARNIKKEGIQATYVDGVLNLTLPKLHPQEVSKVQHIEIQ